VRSTSCRHHGELVRDVRIPATADRHARPDDRPELAQRRRQRCELARARLEEEPLALASSDSKRQGKRAWLRRARVSNLVLCIDEDRDVGDGDLPASAALVRYRRRVDAAKVLEIVAAMDPAT